MNENTVLEIKIKQDQIEEYHKNEVTVGTPIKNTGNGMMGDENEKETTDWLDEVKLEFDEKSSPETDHTGDKVILGKDSVISVVNVSQGNIK